MEYKFKEYERAIDAPTKKIEERAIVEKIMSILNENKKYSSLEDFYNANSTIDEFKKNNEMENVLKHFGNKINQSEYEKIINNLKKLTEQKLSFDKDDINISQIDDKKYVTYEGKDEKFYLNDSYTDIGIDQQLSNLQKESTEFQTADTKENTELLMKEMKKNKKMDLILRYLNEINYEVLNEEQQELFKFAFEYQKNSTGLIRIDLDEKIMVDEEDNIIKLEKIDGKIVTSSSDEKYIDNNKNMEQNLKNNKNDESNLENNRDNNSLSLKRMRKTNLFSEGE